MALHLAQFLAARQALLCPSVVRCTRLMPPEWPGGRRDPQPVCLLQEWSTEMAGQLEPWHILVVSALANARQLKHDAYVVHKIPGRLYTDRTVAEFRKVRRRLGCASAQWLPWAVCPARRFARGH